MDNYDLKKIEKHYGQKFARLCRDLFPTILEKEGVLWQVITSNFAPSHFLYEDIVDVQTEFQTYINNIVFPEKPKDTSEKSNKSVKELFDEAGYILYPECQTEEDIQRFRSFYAPNEVLCTFRGGRLKTCRVWFAVKKDVNNIKRKNFLFPRRDDEYGTSVISIQISRDLPEDSYVSLSIKNRYNHAVKNPDATFCNNLDNIKPGLMQAFFEELGITNMQDCLPFSLEGYVMADDGRFYKSNMECNNIHYCENNVIVDNGRVIKFDPAQYLLIDTFLIDLKNKFITKYDTNLEDSFSDDFADIKDISIAKSENNCKEITIKIDGKSDIIIGIDGRNNITSYTNRNLDKLNKNFLSNNRMLNKLETENVEYVDACCLAKNECLEKFNLPKARIIKDRCLYNDAELKEVNLPSVQKIGQSFGCWAFNLNKFNAENVEQINGNFLYHNVSLEELNLPNLVTVGDSFLLENQSVVDVNLPKLETLGSYFMYYNNSVEKLIAPSIKQIGHYFLYSNKRLCSMFIPEVTSVGIFALKEHSKNKLINKNIDLLVKRNVKKKLDDTEYSRF